MMLSIDTSELKKVRLRLDDKEKTRRTSYAIYADAALPKIVRFLAGKKLRAIGVVVGPGAWSATRTGVALANALAYALELPLAPLTKEQFNSPAPFAAKKRGSVAVVYDAEPNITKKKTRL
jgi:tRNA A37 threonylcarbamoyladenosine modification protein TsaB